MSRKRERSETSERALGKGLKSILSEERSTLGLHSNRALISKLFRISAMTKMTDILGIEMRTKQCKRKRKRKQKCESSEFGCCVDGVTPATGPFSAGTRHFFLNFIQRVIRFLYKVRGVRRLRRNVDLRRNEIRLLSGRRYADNRRRQRHLSD